MARDGAALAWILSRQPHSGHASRLNDEAQSGADHAGRFPAVGRLGAAVAGYCDVGYCDDSRELAV